MIDNAKREIEHDFQEEVPPLRRDATNRVVRLANAFGRFSAVRQMVADEGFQKLLILLLGPNVELTLNRHNHSTINPMDRMPDRLHRDVLQWSRSLVTAIIYLEDSTPENGCTEIIPASHLLPFVGTPNNGGTWMDEHSIYHSLLDQALAIPVKAGGVLFFDSLAFHRAGINSTASLRRSITLGFHSVDELDSRTRVSRVLVAGQQLYRGNELTDTV